MDQRLPPKGTNRVTFRTKIDYPPVTSCIYRIWLGSFYYIGATKNFKKRFGDHRRQFNKAYSELKSDGTYAKMVKHLFNNPYIEEAIVEIVQVCPEDKLYSIEREFHLNALSDKRCLNVFNHHRTRIKALSVPLLGAEKDNS